MRRLLSQGQGFRRPLMLVPGLVAKRGLAAAAAGAADGGATTKGKARHETWRDDNDSDNLPKVRKRDGSFGEIDKTRGFLDYNRIAEPYRDPLERIFDWS